MPSPTARLLRPELTDLLASGAFRDVREGLRSVPPPDVADLLADLVGEGRSTEAALAFRLLPREIAAEVFSHLDADDQEELISELGEAPARRLVEAMDPDDRARLIDELPIEVARPLLARMRPETRRETQAILGYPPRSVGRLMTTEYVRVKPSWTITRALEHIRHYGEDAETLHWVYVIDAEGRLIDDIHIRQMLLGDPEARVSALMDHQFVALSAADDRSEAVRALNRYDRSAMPVVDSLGLLVGIVTHDDVADVAEEEATEDFQKLGGVEALRRPYLDTGTGEMVRKRGVWLAGLFGLQVLTIGVMSLFERQLEALVVLALFVPLIISSGGNTGTQAASLLVRSLAVDEVVVGDWARVLGREVLTGAVLGLALGVMGTLAALLLDRLGVASSDPVHPARLGVVIGLSVLAIVVWGTIAGSMLPLALERLGLDPATSSSPLVATIMDVSGLTIYFGIATVLLPTS